MVTTSAYAEVLTVATANTGMPHTLEVNADSGSEQSLKVCRALGGNRKQQFSHGKNMGNSQYKG